MIITGAVQVLRTKVETGVINTMVNRYSTGIVIPLRGSMDFVFNDTAIRCDKGHGILLPEDSHYCIKGIEATENLLFNFKLDTIPKEPLSIEISDSKVYERIFNELEREIALGNQHKVFSLFYQVLDEAFDKKPFKKQSEKYVGDAELVILRELSNNALTCSFVASEINLSEVYLRKLFVKYRGIPASEYILSMRMKKARAYLSEGYSVGETGRSVGYTDIYQFSRAYKKYYGHSPTKE